MSQSPSRESSNEASREPGKSKRKGTRTVASLTPMQLARKRANDREAQRAIRARTREHIDRLEARVREYENKELQDEKVQRVMKRNQELERQVASLLSQPCPHCSAPAFRLHGGLPPPGPSVSSQGPFAQIRTEYAASSQHPVAAASRAEYAVSNQQPLGPVRSEYNGQAPFRPSYLPTPEPCDSWPTVVPVSSAVTVPSGVSSPCSSVGAPDDYLPGYVPSSLPPPMVVSSAVVPSTPVSFLEATKSEYGELSTAGQDYTNPAASQSSPAYISSSSWSLYPTGPYYPQNT